MEVKKFLPNYPTSVTKSLEMSVFIGVCEGGR